MRKIVAVGLVAFMLALLGLEGFRLLLVTLVMMMVAAA